MKKDKDWKSWKLSVWWMSMLIFFAIGFIVSIAVLTYLSKRHDGFVEVTYDPITSIDQLSSSSIKNSQFRWTFVPAFIFGLYKMMYDSVVSSAGDRQPYVDLAHDEKDAKNAKKTILLEYPSYAVFYRWIVAWRNGHIRLGFAMLCGLISSIIIVPLASSLFRPDTVQYSRNIVLNRLSDFNATALQLRDLQPAIDVSNSIHSYGASAIPWTNFDYALPKFAFEQPQKSRNVSIDTMAFGASLECRIVDEQEMTLNYSKMDVEGLGSFSMEFSDRDCDVNNQNWLVNSAIPYYALTWFQECSGIGDDRIGVFAGIYSDTAPYHLQNLTVISCYPRYWNSSVSTRLNIHSNGDGDIDSLQVTDDPQELFTSFRLLHQQLHWYSVYDATATFKTDAFGKMVFIAAQKLSPGSTINPEAVNIATTVTYKTMFAVFASTELMKPVRVQTDGMLLTNTVRLHIVVPIACALCALLALTLTCSISIMVYTFRNESILREEAAGLLGRARVLYQSDVPNFVASFFQERSQVVGMIKFVKKHYTISDSKCYFGDSATDPDQQAIRIKHLQWNGTEPEPGRLHRFGSTLAVPFRSIASIFQKPGSRRLR